MIVGVSTKWLESIKSLGYRNKLRENANKDQRLLGVKLSSLEIKRDGNPQIRSK